MMKWYLLFFVCFGHLPLTVAVCPPPSKFYIDCGQTRTVSAAIQFCQTRQMTLVNLTNGTSTLSSDIALLNTTLASKNCTGNFWFSSGSQTGLVANLDILGGLLSGLGTVLSNLLCLLLPPCPSTTTAAPITYAYTVCTRSTQQRLVQKCPLTSKPNMQQNQFKQQTMGAGVLSVFSARSQMTCSGLCSSDADCIGISYQNGMCTFYM